MIKTDWQATHIIKWGKCSGGISQEIINTYVMLVDQEVNGYYWAYTKEEWEEEYKKFQGSYNPVLVEISQLEPSPVTWIYNPRTQEWFYVKQDALGGVTYNVEALHKV